MALSKKPVNGMKDILPEEMKIRDFRIRQKRPWIAGFWMELIQLVTIT